MVLPLYLAMTPGEMALCPALPAHAGWLGSHASLTRQPPPPGILAVLTDRLPLPADPAPVAAALAGAAGVLLDFERPPGPAAAALLDALRAGFPGPVAAPPGFDDGLAVFLPPCPLHVPLEAYLAPWQDRAVWLDMTAAQQTITVTALGTTFGPVTAARERTGQFDGTLLCRFRTETAPDAVRFTLFDTAETLARKLEKAAALGVRRAVGLYRELGGSAGST